MAGGSTLSPQISDRRVCRRTEDQVVFRNGCPLPEATQHNSPRKTQVMTRTALVTIALLSSLATPLVVNATGRTAPAEVTTVATAIPVAATPADAVAADPETCRRVKVVYPGYGLSAGATACAAPQAQR